VRRHAEDALLRLLQRLQVLKHPLQAVPLRQQWSSVVLLLHLELDGVVLRWVHSGSKLRVLPPVPVRWRKPNLLSEGSCSEWPSQWLW
jgi:hypothetical protein